MVRDGHLGLNPCWRYDGTIPICPTCTRQYNGTGWTLGINPLMVIRQYNPTCTKWYKGTGWTLGIKSLLVVRWDIMSYVPVSKGTMVWDVGLSQGSPPVPMVHWDRQISCWTSSGIIGQPRRTTILIPDKQRKSYCKYLHIA